VHPPRRPINRPAPKPLMELVTRPVRPALVSVALICPLECCNFPLVIFKSSKQELSIFICILQDNPDQDLPTLAVFFTPPRCPEFPSLPTQRHLSPLRTPPFPMCFSNPSSLSPLLFRDLCVFMFCILPLSKDNHLFVSFLPFLFLVSKRDMIKPGPPLHS